MTKKTSISRALALLTVALLATVVVSSTASAATEMDLGQCKGDSSDGKYYDKCTGIHHDGPLTDGFCAGEWTKRTNPQSGEETEHCRGADINPTARLLS